MSIPLDFETPPPPGAGDIDELLGSAPSLARALLDEMPARVIVLDAAERCVYFNHEFFSFTGLHPKQVLGRHISEIIGPDTYATYAPARERLDRGESVCWEGWTELAGQGRRYMREHLVPAGAEPGKPPRAVVVMSRDLTVLKEREADLQAQVQRLEATEALKSSIVDNALAALVSADAEGRVVDFNPAAEAMFGIARDDALGRPVGELIVPPRHRAAHQEGMRRVNAGGRMHLIGRRVEMEAQRADGQEFPVEMVLWCSRVGGVPHYTASLFDLTERRAQAQEIERQRDALRQSEKLTAMGSLLAGVAHELNNPLAIVMGRASLLEAKCEDEALRSDAQRIRDAAERCGRIVRTFLGMARQKAPQRGEVQLNDMVRGAVDLLHYSLRTGGIEVELGLGEAMPSVWADADQLGQVLLNLIVNAQQALAERPAPRRLRIATGAVQPRPGRVAGVWLQVADNGPGVPEDISARVFDPFFTTKPAGVGTGLGLGVSRSLVREFGGDLILEPERPLGGASFRCWVPVPPSPTAAAAPAEAGDTSTSGAMRARVLVVDDEAELASVLQEMLEAADYEVAIAESGEVALAMLAEARFDAVVSDLRMPGMDGVALWQALDERTPRLARRMVFVTGDTLSPSAREFLQGRCCGCLEKPFAAADLLRCVQAALDQADA